jgi:hypothetical protein
MLKEFTYVRKSGRGRSYKVSYLVQITNGYLTIHKARFSIEEMFYENRKQLKRFLLEHFKASDRVVRNNRKNTGVPTHPCNPKGYYFNVDGKLYRRDKNLEYRVWCAPITDVLRILYVMTGEFDNDERYMEIPDLPDNFLKER